MEYIIKYLFILICIFGGNWYYGYDARFTFINCAWSIFILWDLYKGLKSKQKQ